MHNHVNPTRFIGCDVGKTSLVFFEIGDSASCTLANRRTDIEAFAGRFDQTCLIVCEATGGHEALLLDVLTKMGIPAHRADARKVKAFIRSFGTLGKTDDIDARHLAHYAKERYVKLPLWRSQDENLQKLQTLVLARQDMVDTRTAFTNRLKAPGAKHARAQYEALVKALKAQITAIETAIKALVKSTQKLSQRQAVLISIPGIGAKTATALIALMPELGTMHRRQAAALAGLAPHPRQSGAANAYRRTKGGRPHVKHALFMAALGASTQRSKLNPAYRHFIQNGKKPMVALTAIMRKLIVVANAKLRDHAIRADQCA
jgi:transposase